MDDDEKQYPLVLARTSKEFKIEWWGTNDLNEPGWNTEWDDTMTNTIPQMLRVHLVLGANTAKGENAPEFAATHIYTVPSQMMPVVVQRGLGGGWADKMESTLHRQTVIIQTSTEHNKMARTASMDSSETGGTRNENFTRPERSRLCRHHCAGGGHGVDVAGRRIRLRHES